MEFQKDTVIAVDEAGLAAEFGWQAWRDMRDEFNRGNHARAVMQHFEQERLHRKRHGAGACGTVERTETLGECKLNVTEWIFHYWGQRLGYECWDDEDFVREFGRDNEACRVHERTGKVTVVNNWGIPRFQMSDGGLVAKA